MALRGSIQLFSFPVHPLEIYRFCILGAILDVVQCEAYIL
jgi:hypothetical protein